MTMDFNAAPQDFSPVEAESEMPFAGVPTWDQRGKARVRTSSTAPRTSASRSSMKSSTAPLAIAAGIVVLGAVAATGWYATRPHDTAVAELTPGQAAPSDTTTTTTTSQAAPAAQQVAQASPPPAVSKTVTSSSRTTTSAEGDRTTTRSRTVTHRSASPSASDATADVSTTAPMPSQATAPQAQQPTNPGAAPLVLNLPQTTPAPAPAQQAAPPAAAPAPVVTAPTTQAAPQTAAPPTAAPPSDAGTPPTA